MEQKQKNDLPMLIRDQVFNFKPYLKRINKNKKRKMILRYL